MRVKGSNKGSHETPAASCCQCVQAQSRPQSLPGAWLAQRKACWQEGSADLGVQGGGPLTEPASPPGFTQLCRDPAHSIAPHPPPAIQYDSVSLQTWPLHGQSPMKINEIISILSISHLDIYPPSPASVPSGPCSFMRLPLATRKGTVGAAASASRVRSPEQWEHALLQKGPITAKRGKSLP